jgi:hypothetical protein
MISYACNLINWSLVSRRDEETGVLLISSICSETGEEYDMKTIVSKSNRKKSLFRR